MHPDALYLPISGSRALLDRAKATVGDESRMRGFVRKLVTGESAGCAPRGESSICPDPAPRTGQPCKMAVLGSSLATSRGASHIDTGWTSLVHKWLELAFTPCGHRLGPAFRHHMSSPHYWLERHLCNERYEVQ